MKILITGGTGLLGSALLRLYHQQHELRAMVRRRNALQHLDFCSSITAHYGDLVNRESVINASKGVDAIIHCAALSSPWASFDAFYQNNIVATQNVVEAAAINGVAAVIHISTTSLYFDFRDRWQIKENEPLAQHWCNDYAKTKYLSEQVVLNSPVKSMVLRPRGIFGPNDRAIVPRLLRALKGNRLFLPSSRNPVIDLTYVDNVAHAAMLACERAEQLPHGEIFNISNAQPMAIEQILSQLFSAMKREVLITHLPYFWLKPFLVINEKIRQCLPQQPEPLLTAYSAALFHYHQTLDISKAKQLLGYQPSLSIEQGIKQYANWHQTQNS